MLWSFAVENLLKAAIVRKDSKALMEQFQKKNKFPSKLKSHKLVDLVKEAGLAITLEEEDLLRRLTRSAIWNGRYPVPLDFKEMSGVEEFSDGQSYSISWRGRDDIGTLDALLSKIEQHLGRDVQRCELLDLAKVMEH